MAEVGPAPLPRFVYRHIPPDYECNPPYEWTAARHPVVRATERRLYVCCAPDRYNDLTLSDTTGRTFVLDRVALETTGSVYSAPMRDRFYLMPCDRQGRR